MIKKNRKNQALRAWRDDKEMYNLGKMVENGYTGLKCSRKVKRGSNYKIIQVENEKIRGLK